MGPFLIVMLSASWPILGEIIFSGKANRGAIWAILWPMYIYKALPLYSGFGFTFSKAAGGKVRAWEKPQ